MSTETRAEGEDSFDVSWPVQYLQEHVVHIGVVAFLAAYPLIYNVLVASPVSAEMIAFLPEVDTMITVFYFGLFAMSFDFISGYTGYLSFGHAAFYGTGAYFVAFVAKGKIPFLPPDTPFMVLLVLGGVTAAILAVLVGTVSFRLSGVYFAMITLGFAQVLYVFVSDWSYVSENPSQGLSVFGREAFAIGVPWVDALNLAIGPLAGDEIKGLLGFLSFSATEVSYYMIGLVVLLCYFAMQRIIHSPFGRVMIAIRENEERAKAVGYNTFWYKLGAFSISAFFAGIAGGLLVGYRRSATPDNAFHFLVTGKALLVSIIGGFGTLAGPLYGTMFDQGLREFLSKRGAGGGLLPYLRGHVGEAIMTTEVFNGLTVQEAIGTFLNGHASLYIGALFVVFVLYVPYGMLGTVRVVLGGTVAEKLPKRFSTVADRLSRRTND